jgi:hypothetical protein
MQKVSEMSDSAMPSKVQVTVFPRLEALAGPTVLLIWLILGFGVLDLVLGDQGAD